MVNLVCKVESQKLGKSAYNKDDINDLILRNHVSLQCACLWVCWLQRIPEEIVEEFIKQSFKTKKRSVKRIKYSHKKDKSKRQKHICLQTRKLKKARKSSARFKNSSGTSTELITQGGIRHPTFAIMRAFGDIRYQLVPGLGQRGSQRHATYGCPTVIHPTFPELKHLVSLSYHAVKTHCPFHQTI